MPKREAENQRSRMATDSKNKERSHKEGKGELPDCEVPSYCQGEEAEGEESPGDQEDPAAPHKIGGEEQDRRGEKGRMRPKGEEGARSIKRGSKKEAGLLQGRGQV